MFRSSRAAGARLVEGALDRAARLGWQLVDPAEEPDPDPFGAQLGGLIADGTLEQPEQPDDFLVGAGPVLATEGVQRQDRDTAADRVPQQVPDGLDAGGVTLELGDVPLAGPAAIAIHDDGDVTRQLLGRQERLDRGLTGGRDADRFGRLVSDRRSVGRPGQRSAGH